MINDYETVLQSQLAAVQQANLPLMYNQANSSGVDFDLGTQNQLKRRRKDLQADIADADRKHKDLVAEVGHLSKETSHRASRLDEARSNQSAGRSNNRVLESLQTLAASGRVSVFHVRRLSYPNPVLYLII